MELSWKRGSEEERDRKKEGGVGFYTFLILFGYCVYYS
jgi:hypothetical protein